MQSSLAIPTNKRLVPFLAILGILLGLWLAMLENGRINGDADLYLEMASRFAQDDAQGALSLYQWPLLPWLMAQVHYLTGLDVESAGRLLGAIFFGIATWGFLELIREAGGSRNAILAGALLLFSSPYIVGDVLPMIMRDQGFWAFYLLALLFFLRFYRSLSLADAMLWQLCVLVATLFRVEAVSFILLMPLLLPLRRDISWRSRLQSLGMAYLVPLMGIILVILGGLLLPAAELQQKLGRLAEVQSSLQSVYHQISGGLAAKARIYGDQVLGKYMDNYAMLGLCLTLFSVIAGKIIGASGWLGIVLATTGKRCQAPAMDPDARTVLLWAAGINLLNLAVILLTAYLLSARYAVGMGFIVLVFAAFNLGGLCDRWLESGARRSRWLALGLLLAALLMAYHLVRSLAPHDADYNYEQAAVAWVKQHAAKDARIYYDGARLRYYAHAPWGGRADEWENNLPALQATPARFDYLLLTVKGKNPNQLALLEQLAQYRKVQEFRRDNSNAIVVMVSRELPD
ncbi:MAG TPA: hypothetical protein PKW44_00145 [Methylophilaceae bacterium]|nr:hypothetical protein [Methylophilaceae bacterium]